MKNQKFKFFHTVKYDGSSAFAKIERHTFKLHIFSQILNGIAIGIMSSQDIILKKSLLSSDFAVALLIFLTSSSMLFSIYGVELIHRARNTGKAIIVFALISRSFIFMIPLFETPAWFIFCIAAVSYTDALIKPFWNHVLKHNYSDEKRSSFYSFISASNTLFFLIFATFLGFILDIDYRFYKLFFPLAGILDVISYFSLAKVINLKIDASNITQEKFGKVDRKLLKDILILPLRAMLKIFRENREFLRFEKYFMLYGISFMILLTAIPIYLVQTLQLGYIPISTARGLVFQSAIIIFTPFMGKYFGTGNPVRFTGLIFIMLSLFPFFLLAVEVTPLRNIIQTEILIYIAYFIFGLCMSGVNITWNLSSIYYAPPHQVSNYQAVHITLTGLRGAFAPFLGYAILKLFSISSVFVISGLLLVTAGIMMIREKRIKVRAGI